MPNLDFYIKDNGRIDYSKDLSVTQYSTGYVVRLLTKTTFYVVNMNITTGTGLNTYKKNLILQPVKENGYWHYDYQLGLDATGYEFSGDKSILKISFVIYPIDNDLNTSMNSSVCYLPLLKNIQQMPYDLNNVTNDTITSLQAALNDLEEAIANAGYGELDTAKNYDTLNGNIKAKFDELLAMIQNNANDIDTVEALLGNTTNPDVSIAGSIAVLQQYINNLQYANEQLQSDLATNSASISANASDISDIKADINTIKTFMQAGLRYDVVYNLPSHPQAGVIYLIRDDGPNEDNNYKEYLWTNNQWELLGDSRTDIELSNYATNTQLSNVQTSLGNLTTRVGNDELILAAKSDKTYVDNTFATREYSDATYVSTTALNNTLNSYYTKTQEDANNATLQNNINTVDNKVAVEKGRIDTLSGDLLTLTGRVNTHDSNLTTLSGNIEDVRAIALGRATSVSYNTDELMWQAAAQVQPLWKVGTTIYIKESDIPDYWVAQVYDSPVNGLYYELLPLESDLDDYYTKVQVNAIEDALDLRLQAVEARYTDAEVDTLLSNLNTTIRADVADIYATKTALGNAVNDLNTTITTKETALSNRITANANDIDALETALGNEINRAQLAETQLSTDITTALNTAEAYTDAEIDKIEDGTYTAKYATALEDYVDDSKKIRFATNSVNTDFVISEVDISAVNTLLSVFAPNEYN